MNEHPPAPKGGGGAIVDTSYKLAPAGGKRGGGGAIINFGKLLKFAKVCGATSSRQQGRWCNRASIKIKSASF